MFQLNVDHAVVRPLFSNMKINKPLPSTIVSNTSTLLHPIKEFVTSTQGITLGLLPFNVLDIGANCCSLIEDKPANKKIKTLLDILSGLKEVGEGTATFAEYLVGLQAISEASTAWTGPFGLAMSILSIASIARKAGICKETHNLLEEINAIAEGNRNKEHASALTYHALLRWIEEKHSKDPDFISDVFNAKETAFAQALIERKNAIDLKLASSNEIEKEDGCQLASNTIKSLRGRVQKNIISSAVSIVASVVSMIGAIIIFICPVLPVGWSLVALSALIDGGRFVYHKVSEYQFAEEIGLKRTPFEWIAC